MRLPHRIFTAVLATLSFLLACKKINNGDVKPVIADSKPSTGQPASDGFKTKNVIIVVVDGPRYSETWGDSTHANIPNRYALRTQGVVLTSFANQGFTFTDPGHDCICTGYRENINNGGAELPQYPSIFQAWLKATGKSADKAWVVASKDKLEILSNCKQPDWADTFRPKTDCGVNGLGTGYRSDDTTYAHAKRIMATYHPNLMLINLKNPDFYGHANQYANYINGIKTTDAQVKGIYDAIQADPQYRDQTTLIVTNDHGRHPDGWADGFVSHGDGCAGCRHIEFLAIGPDFKKNAMLSTNIYDQRDISKTVAKLMGFEMPFGDGKVMTDLFKN